MKQISNKEYEAYQQYNASEKPKNWSMIGLLKWGNIWKTVKEQNLLRI